MPRSPPSITTTTILLHSLPISKSSAEKLKQQQQQRREKVFRKLMTSYKNCRTSLTNIEESIKSNPDPQRDDDRKLLLLNTRYKIRIKKRRKKLRLKIPKLASQLNESPYSSEKLKNKLIHIL